LIRRDTCFTDEQSTATHKFFSLAVNPNIEILMHLISRKRNMHTFNNPATLRCRE